MPRTICPDPEAIAMMIWQSKLFRWGTSDGNKMIILSLLKAPY